MATAKTKSPKSGPESLTADDLLHLHNQGIRGELVRGVFTERMSSGIQHGTLVVNLASEMRTFVKPRRLGRLVASDSGVKLGRNPDTVREPDIAFFSVHKMPLDAEVPGYAEVPPDLVVEVVSPSNTHREVSDKALMWLNAGVTVVWVVDSIRRRVEVHRQGREVLVLAESDTLDGEDVLPGFSCLIANIFTV